MFQLGSLVSDREEWQGMTRYIYGQKAACQERTSANELAAGASFELERQAPNVIEDLFELSQRHLSVFCRRTRWGH
jgi:hypothetical protein